MKCVIVEDEYAAAMSLSALIKENVPDMDVVAVLQSVEESIEWFGANPSPDMAFMDIHLSIDYLLKPVGKENLLRAVEKYRRLTAAGQEPELYAEVMKRLMSDMRNKTTYKSALLIPSGEKLIPLPVKEIAYIYTENKIVRIVCNDEREIYIDRPLDELYSMLDPHNFYRANRQYIISRDSVRDLSLWFNGRLSVNLTVKTPEKIVVSRANAADFKKWVSD